MFIFFSLISRALLLVAAFQFWQLAGYETRDMDQFSVVAARRGMTEDENIFFSRPNTAGICMASAIGCLGLALNPFTSSVARCSRKERPATEA